MLTSAQKTPGGALAYGRMATLRAQRSRPRAFQFEVRMGSRNILVTGPAINEQAVKLIAENGYQVSYVPLTRAKTTWSGL